MSAAPPKVVGFADIRRPDAWTAPPAPDQAEEPPRPPCRGSHLHGLTSPSPAIPGSGGHACPAGRPGQRSSDRTEQVDGLFDQFILRHWTPRPRERNAFVIRAVPFLYSAVCEAAIPPLCQRYYDENALLLKDSQATHEESVRAHLGQVAKRYEQGLTPAERAVYAHLTPRQREAMRSCWHLAGHESSRRDCRPGTFILSYPHLGERLLADPKSA